MVLTKDQNKENHITITGVISSNFKFSHSHYSQKHYLAEVSIKRMSGSYDLLPIMCMEKGIDLSTDYTGRKITAEGIIKTYNIREDGKSKLKIFIDCKKHQIVSNEIPDRNEGILQGYLCKKPIYRMTPRGKTIADILVAVNRSHGRSDYIPGICWGGMADFIKDKEVGKKFTMAGRLQSRPYEKRTEDATVIKNAYEFSIMKIEEICHGNCFLATE